MLSDLRDIVLRCLWGMEGHVSHGHHDGLIGGVDRCCGGLRRGPNGRVVAWNGGPRRLHLRPLEKLRRERRDQLCGSSLKTLAN